MKKIIITTHVFLLFYSILIGQNLTQTVRGSLVDSDSKLPLIGAVVRIVDTEPLVAAVTDNNGNFRFENIPVGRITLQLSYLGYETKSIPNVEVNSGKEVVLQLQLQESVIAIDEAVIKANNKRGDALNDMALLSARSISVEETKRYAGGMDDPARVVSNFAGVSFTADGSSDIIVRGNAPKYLQWRVDGIEVTSPYHFDDQNASFGALTALNNNLLNASDFYTAAFSAEYGNVLSSVFDLRLRQGNNEKFEAGVGVGLLGTDVTFEGPFKKGYGGSFLVNYRYSTVSLIQDLGLVDVEGALNYQDANLKMMFPTKKAGTFSVFAFGGPNNFIFNDVESYFLPTPGDRNMLSSVTEDYHKRNYLVNTGINHTVSINERSYIKTSLAYSASEITDQVYESKLIKVLNNEGEFLYDSLMSGKKTFDNQLLKSTYRGAVTYNNKINARHKIQVGLRYALRNYSFSQQMVDADGQSMVSLVDFNEYISTLQNYVNWKFRLNENISFVSGIHNMNVMFNNKSTIEPRVAFHWKINRSNSIHAGYGNHSMMESIHHYFAKVENNEGRTVEPNKNLGLLRAHHYVVGYEKRFNGNFMAKVEAYYQHLYNLPVENNDTSYFATINEGLDYRYVDLVNEGTGKNYGLEVTFERFFNNDYFFLVNASLFNSTYTALDGVERNSRYNKNYVGNLLIGKEFHNLGKKRNQSLSVNLKTMFQGGERIVQLLRDGEGNLVVEPENNRYWDYANAFETKLDDIFQVNISGSYKFNRKKTTHEIFLDLHNVTNQEGRIREYYDEKEPNSVGYLKQSFFFPNLMYRVYF